METVTARFFAKVNKKGPRHPKLKTRCWLWVGAKTPFGYGNFFAYGMCQKAHRVSWYLLHGKWPRPQALHACDNPSCVNPAHLFEGTQKNNVTDMLRKNRRAPTRGAANPNSTLTEEQVLTIAKSTESGPTLARRYGVRHQTIYSIRNGKLWSSVTQKGAQ